MISLRMMTKILCLNFRKKFSRMRKNGFKKNLSAHLPSEFFHDYIIDNVKQIIIVI